MIAGAYYQAPQRALWKGRIDGTQPEHCRWHQHIKFWDLNSEHPNEANFMRSGDLVLLGFACDEGVRRNQGRTGAKEGPEAIRKALCNLPVHQPETRLWDAGDIICPEDANLEEAQRQLSHAVNTILSVGGFPIVLGGGHEVTYGHYRGIRSYLDLSEEPERPAPSLGIINFDAHFDSRIPIPQAGHSGASSGTGFFQIEQELSGTAQPFRYMAIGIQQAANTRALFQQADTSSSTYILAEELYNPAAIAACTEKIKQFIQRSDRIYITLDLDVFASAYAPGVSAPTAMGVIPDHGFFTYLDTVLQSEKLLSLDIAELNPSLDLDQRTAKLAAALIFRIIEKLNNKG